MGSETKHKELLLQFIASLTLCENIGDILDDIESVFKRLEMKIPFEDFNELGTALREMKITTLYGTEI